jgi:hypothetical protein
MKEFWIVFSLIALTLIGSLLAFKPRKKEKKD